MKFTNIFILSILIFVGCAHKKGAEVTYQTEETKMQGYIANVEDGNTKKPGVLVVHEWWGHNEYARKRADMLAKEGYVAMAVDMYGNGKQADHPKKAAEFSSAVFKNFDEAKARFEAALNTLKAHPQVDKERIAAIGYCFGGGIVLSMARTGLPLDGAVSYHGSLQSPVKVKKGDVKAKVLVFNGGSDPMVKDSHIKSFKKEMKRGGAELTFVNFPNAVHAFTNPEATKLGKKFNLPLAYDKKADEESWNKTLKFFSEIF